MTDEEFKKILADPEMQRLIKANGLSVPPQWQPTLQIEAPQIDPQLVRQMKQYLALRGGGDFGEQVGANFNAGCAQIMAGIGIFLIGVLAVIALVVFLAALGSAVNVH